MTNEEKQARLEAFLAREVEAYRKNVLWLQEAMPESFFSLIGEDNALLVAHSLVGFDLQDCYAEINLKNAAIVLCLDGPDSDRKIYTKYQSRSILTMHVFLSQKKFALIEKDVRIAVLFFGELEEEQITKESRFECDARFRSSVLPSDWQIIETIVRRAEKSDLMQAELVKSADNTSRSRFSMQLFVACRGAPRGDFVPRLLFVLASKKLRVCKVNLTFLSAESPERILVFTCQLHGFSGANAWEAADMEQVMQELLLTRHFSMEDSFEESYLAAFGDGLAVNFLRATACFVHEVLVNQDPNMYALDNVQEAFCYWPEIGMALYKLFCLRSDPYKLDKTVYASLREKLLLEIERQDTGKEASDIRRKSVLKQSVFFVDSIQKTNFFVANKAALAFRLDAGFMQELNRDLLSRVFPKMPFAVFYSYNRDSFGFHIRFQDLSRGGLRTIALRDPDLAAEEMPLVFHECYQLALTQHKKNKDLPEGGAKGILFLQGCPVVQDQFLAHLYRAQRIFIESLLSLVNSGDNGRLKEGAIVDYYGKPEYLYIGPDENMHDSMIEWIAEYSKKVGYKPAGAFISSKPKAGINHKQYGVTSLGVTCCMEEVLKFLQIDPHKQVFQVKMSGGPDGDVAGNQILNLYRRYPDTAKLIALIDISGVIYEPQGLDLAFLAELFFAAKPIRFYPPEKLSEGAFLLDMHSEKREGVHIVKHLRHRRQESKLVQEWISATEAHQITRSFVHQVPADVFIPAGGRPSTLNRLNIRDFLLTDGTPSAKIIVEGANLYLSPAARKLLEDKSTLIIKDSSANKGGVICSSFEVLASLSLSDNEFIDNKDEIVRDILRKIEEYARLEVQLILKTYSQTQEACSVISEKISEHIDLYASQIREYLDAVSLSKDLKDPLLSCFLEYALPTLIEKYPERLLERIPEMHKKAIIAAWISSKVVYLRGLDWAPSIVDVLPIICQDPRITSCVLKF